MSSHYTVIYDANVLYPAPIRSFLMYLAVSGEFRARWTAQIHTEWMRNLLVNRPDIDPAKLEQVRSLMDTNVPGCLVTGYESLIDSITLPDSDDRHVVAAAIKTRAEAIITFNLADFPEAALTPFDIVALHPDEFIANLMSINSAAVVEAARQHRADLRNPPFTATEYLDLLQRQQLPETVSLLRPFALLL